MNESPPDLSARRPLKSRSAGWAGGLARLLLKTGWKPNQVSVCSVVFASVAMAALLCPAPGVVTWVVAALAIQLRLLCNLMDGMLAVEGGLKSPDGDLFNEFPDRLADLGILAALGHAGGGPLPILLGWLAACGALITASVRLHGASLLGIHDFRGPMAKPQRMALATGICLIMAVLAVIRREEAAVVTWGLGVMVAGIAVTLLRRLTRLSRTLHERASSPP